MTDEPDLKIPRLPAATPTEFLIRHHYREFGCADWNRGKFLRLAAAFNETPSELAARIGLSPSELQKRFECDKFRLSEGILLSLYHRFLESVTTGQAPKGDLFYPHDRLRRTQVQEADQRAPEGNLHG